MLAVAASSAILLAQAGWVPARWPSADPKSLDLLSGTPVNCLLIDERHWSAAFNAEATRRGVASLAVVRPAGKAVESARRALDLQFRGVVLEGDFAEPPPLPAKTTVISLGLRSQMKLDGSEPVIGTFQGLWPGVRAEEEGKTHAAASGAPWIDTNAGFLRFARASASKSHVWISVTPPVNGVFSLERYLQAIGDAAMCGARWVLAFDPDFYQRLFAREAKALRQWKRIGDTLAFYESHPAWRDFTAYGKLALIQSPTTGAFVSGGVLDMIAVKHTPVQPVPSGGLKGDSLAGAQMAVAVDPDSMTPEQKETIRNFTRSGGTVLTGPPGWRFPQLKPGQITLGEQDLEKLDLIWKEMNSMTGRRNLGARLFNVSTMLSNLQISPDRKQVILQLVNYSDFPVDDVTVHLLGNYKSATLLRPEAAAVPLELYPTDEGAGFDIAQVVGVATVVLEPQL